MAEPTKTCSKCGEAKALDEFYKHSASKSGLTPRCRQCIKADRLVAYWSNPEADRQRAREWSRANPERRKASLKAWAAANPEKWSANQRRFYLKSKYGMTPQQFDALLASQGGRCAICDDAEPGKQGWHVDHDHANGDVRGLLCAPCNKGLGLFRDSPARLHAAERYLQRFRTLGAVG